MNGQRPLNVLMIGAGNIAGAFDESRPAGAWPLTHAGAFARDGRFRVTACVEPDERRRYAFGNHWRVEQMLASVNEVDPNERFDVISICSPTHLHEAHLDFSLTMAPRLVFCEKPLTGSLKGSATAVEQLDGAGIALAVNHTRRWAPDVLKLACDLHAGAWGRIRSVSGIYNKGILNNGSHLIDLLSMLLGHLDIVWVGEPDYDYWKDDPTIPFVLRSSDGKVVSIVTGDARDFALFELQVVTERGVINMESGGTSWRLREVAASKQFNGYRSLSDATLHAGKYEQAMAIAVDNLWHHLERGAPLACTGRDALHAQALCEIIQRKAIQGISIDELSGEYA